MVVVDGGRPWVGDTTFDAALERLAAGNVCGCLVHQDLLGDDGLGKVSAIRQIDPVVPVLISAADDITQLKAWEMGADGAVRDGGLVLGEVDTILTRLRQQRHARIQNRAAATERRVLVVDDDEDLLPLFCIVLERAGFHVLPAQNAMEELRLLHDDEVHVMLTDIMMPKISGTELVASTLAYAPQVVPLVITGLPRINAAVESMRAGAHDFLVKPVDPEQLVERVERAWRRWLLGWRSSPTMSVRSGLRVLLVENNPADTKLITALFESSVSDQFTLSHADHLETAIELFREEGFDVVLLDLNLPDSQGLETYAAFRKAAGAVPVLALTDSKSGELEEQVVLCGAQDYIKKSDVTGPLLLSRILYSVERAAMIDKLESFAQDVRASDVSRRRIIERNADAMFVVGTDRRIRFLNPAAEALLGEDMDALVGTEFAYNAATDRLVEIQIPRPGDVRFAEIRTVETQWEGETARLATIRDVTDRKRSESKLKQLADELQAANTKLERLSAHDVLTEVFNRRGLESRLRAELNRALRDGGYTAAMLIDCDEFKTVNDSLGHAVGDRALQETARRIAGAVREADVVGRIGGDEFLVILPDTDVAEALVVGERIRLAVADGELLTTDKVSMTISVGVTRVPSSAVGIETVLELTRTALHKSKTEGRNQVCGAGIGQLRSSSPANLLADLMSDQGIRPLWQPIVHIESGATVGFELLSRGPKGGFESPIDFLRLARSQDRLGAVDLRCLDVCLDAVRSVENLQPNQLVHANLFPSTVLTMAPDALLQRIDPQNLPGPLCLELSEQEFLGLSGDLAARLAILKKEGILIAIDDVGGIPGTVETALMVEPDILKIDRLLIHGSAEDPLRGHLLGRLLRVARSLEIDVVAEGVEREADAKLLMSLGVSRAQGYLWSKPVPVPSTVE